MTRPARRWRLRVALLACLASTLAPAVANGAFGPPVADGGGSGSDCIANCGNVRGTDGGAVDLVDFVDDLVDNDPSGSADDVLVVQTMVSGTQLRPGDVIDWLFDSDGDAATGDASGFDRRVRLAGRPGLPPSFVLERASGPLTFAPIDDVPLALRLDNVLLRVKTSDLGIARGAAFGLAIESSYTPQDDRGSAAPTYRDRLPDSGVSRRATVPAPPPGPLVSLGAPASIGVDRAVLTGTVDPQRPLRTVFGVEYGPSPALGSALLTGAVGAPGAAPVSVALPDLRPATLYYYRLTASNTFDARARTSVTAVSTFTTAPLPVPTIGSVEVDDVGRNGARLVGLVNPNGLATSYRFEYGPSERYGRSTAPRSIGGGTTEVRRTEEIGGLAPSRRYHYRLVAVSAAGESRSKDGVFRTSGDPRLAGSLRAGVRCGGRGPRVACRINRLSLRLRVAPADGSAPGVAADPSPRGTTITIRCRRGCPSTATELGVLGRATNLVPALRDRGLRAGAVIEIRATRPRTIGLYRRLTVSRAPRGRVTVRSCAIRADGRALFGCGKG